MLPLLIAAGLAIGGVVIAANWNSIVNWLKDFVPKLRAAWNSVRENVPHGARIFGDIIVEGAERLARIIHKLYYKENGQWIEETTTRKVSEDEVPASIRNKINRKEADITEEIEKELKECAETSASLDDKMQKIKNRIEC